MTDDVIYLPLGNIENSIGFSFDIGGSVCKLIYRSKEDYCNGKLKNKKDGQTMGPMRLKLTKRHDPAVIVKTILEECDLTRHTDRPEVTVTGVGGNLFRAVIEEQMNISLKVLSEFDMTVDTVVSRINNCAAEELFYPLSPEGIAEGERVVKLLNSWLQAEFKRARFQKLDYKNWQVEDNTPTLPCILITCGSAFTFIKVFEDRTFEFLDILFNGGKAVGNLLKLLVNEEDSEKLLEVASTSDGRTVDLFSDDIMSKSGSKDIYNTMPEDVLMFPLGKVDIVSRDKIKDGDIVHSIMRQTCVSLAHTAHLNSIKHKCNKVYFCGNFVNHEFIRRFITTQCVMENTVTPEQKMDFQFIRYGGFLPSIGAFMAGSNDVSDSTQ